MRHKDYFYSFNTMFFKWLNFQFPDKMSHKYECFEISPFIYFWDISFYPATFKLLPLSTPRTFVFYKMYKFLLALCFCGVLASEERGAVRPIITCGGLGAPIEVRVTDCTDTPCRLVVGKPYLIEIDFIPYADSDQLSFNLMSILEDGTQLPGLDVPMPNSPVSAGERYTSRYSLTPQRGLELRTFDVQIRLYDTASQRIEICVRAPVTVVPL